ncbi:MAG: hypothetical protein Q7T78_12555, partial [Rhodoferax sp.]|nr:hypothetical protein [Rhodoferax sp.]
ENFQPLRPTRGKTLAVMQSCACWRWMRMLTRDIGLCLVDRYSERKESAEELSKRVNQKTL